MASSGVSSERVLLRGLRTGRVEARDKLGCEAEVVILSAGRSAWFGTIICLCSSYACCCLLTFRSLDRGRLACHEAVVS